jgi:dipeptidyl aminopeptidase/acylaminoacyl peptidase
MRARQFLNLRSKTTSILIQALLLAAGGIVTPAQQPPLSANTKWTVDDVVMIEQAAAFEVSPDSRWVVWEKNVADKEKNARYSNLFLSSLTEKKETQLTRGTDTTVTPRWSPDGQLIAYSSTKADPKSKPAAGAGEPAEEPKPQIWLINPFGGEPWQLTSFSRGVSNFQWADADSIVFAAQEEPSHYESAIKEKKDTSVVVEDELHAPPARLFKAEVKTKKIARLTDNADRITRFALSPDGTKAVAVHDRSLRYIYDNKIKPAVFLWDLKTGQAKQIFEDRKFNVGRLYWTRDGKGFYARSEFTNDPEYVMATIEELYYFDLGVGQPIKVDLAWENGLAGEFAVTDDGFVCQLASGTRFTTARFVLTGSSWKRDPLEGEHARNIWSFALGKDNRTLVYLYTTASTPEQWYRATLNGFRLEQPSVLTDLNPGYKKKTKAKTEVVRWKGSLDEEVEGVLYYPHDYEAGKKYPLIVMIHGGPTGYDPDAWTDSFFDPNNLLCQRGTFVLKPNYHGSGNYGLKWVESIGRGKYYDLEVPDIEKGIDWLIARGFVDPDKLGVMGWSNGSILTIALTINSSRYKAASAGAGDVEWVSDWGTAHFGAAFDNYYLGKSPLEAPELYFRKSPFFKLGRVRTPTIIYFGTEDTSVPTQQGWLHYRALQQLGKADVRFVLFPGEKHVPEKLVHQRRKTEEDLKWFDKYLFGTLKEEDEALKPDSPLAVALKLKGVKADGLRYGLMVKSTLIPEVVSYADVELGRFEITRAQFAAFDKSYVVETGKENHPANGISFERAQAYCEWLSRLTGQTFRLATEAEAEKIYGEATTPENTLDYWAGYALNPEDAKRLLKKLEELGGRAPLLKEVGGFKGSGTDDHVFDLGGNVAEWIVAKDGKGRLMGASADTAADTKTGSRKPSSEYVGFRVVRVPAGTAPSGNR